MSLTAHKILDAASYGRLIEPLLEQAAGYARSILRHRPDAEDAVQQAALRGLERIESYNPARPFKGWWFAILRNCCIDSLRRRGNAAKTGLNDHQPPAPHPSERGEWESLAEDLFVLAAETGIQNISVILSPVDFRVRKLPAELPPLPPWTGELYEQLRTAMTELLTWCGRPGGNDTCQSGHADQNTAGLLIYQRNVYGIPGLTGRPFEVVIKWPRSTVMRIDKLPEHLRPLFWDYDFARLAWPEDRDLVIARILQEGDDRANVWLYRELGPTELAAWIRDQHGRGLDPRRLRFWQAILKLPEQEVAPWLRDARATPGKVQ